MEKKYSLTFGLLLIALGAAVFFLGRDLPSFVLGGRQLPGPKFFPFLLAGLFIVAGAWESLVFFRAGGFQHKASAFPKLAAEHFRDPGVQRFWFILIGLVLFVPLIQLLGFVIGSFLFATAVMVRLKAKVWSALLVAAILTVVIALIFGRLFRIPLPEGIFGITL